MRSVICDHLLRSDWCYLTYYKMRIDMCIIEATKNIKYYLIIWCKKVCDHAQYTVMAQNYICTHTHTHIYSALEMYIDQITFRFSSGLLRRLKLFAFDLAERNQQRLAANNKKKPEPRGVKTALPFQYNLKCVCVCVGVCVSVCVCECVWLDINVYIWRTLNNFHEQFPAFISLIRAAVCCLEEKQMKSCVIFITSKLGLLSNTIQSHVCQSIWVPVFVCGCVGVSVGNDWSG